jgi:hypothetical protein
MLLRRSRQTPSVLLGHRCACVQTVAIAARMHIMLSLRPGRHCKRDRVFDAPAHAQHIALGLGKSRQEKGTKLR